MPAEATNSAGLERLTFMLAALAVATAATSQAALPLLPLGCAAVQMVAVLAARSWLKPGPQMVGAAPAPPAWAAPLILVLLIQPLVCEPLRAWLTGDGQPFQWQFLAGLCNVVLALAAMSRWPRYLRLTGLASLFVVLFAVSLGEGPWVTAACGTYLLTAGAWLLRLNWVGRRGVVGSVACEPLPRRALAIVLVSVAGAAILGAALAPPAALSALRGFLPTSGGTLWYDPSARGGVNDGDDVVAAEHDAQSVGMTDSSLFLDSQEPTFYDSISETYGEPITRKKNERAIGLGYQETKEPENRAAENLKAGREFATVRGRRPKPRPMGDLASEALLFVEGRVPLHLRLAAYDRFDGVTWHAATYVSTVAEAAPDATERLVRTNQGAWMGLAFGPDLPVFSGAELHTVKIARLATDAVPLPSHPTRFRLEIVDRVDFFRWSAGDTLHVNRSQIPHGTVIDTDCRIADGERLRCSPKFVVCLPGIEPETPADFSTTISSQVRLLAESWTAGLPPGWRQVEAVVERLRLDYALDRDAQLPADCTDAVAHFLFQAGRGPDYEFASAAAVLLRSLGYSTRLVSGFYADPKRFDWRARNTPVAKDDVHLWTEVRLAGGVWTPIEPTPGYELLRARPSAMEMAAVAVGALGRWALAHWVALAIIVACGALGVRHRAELADLAATLRWRWSGRGSCRRRVLATLRLLDGRVARARLPRPPAQTPRRWFGRLAAQIAPELGDDVRQWAFVIDWVVHAPPHEASRMPLGNREVNVLCDRLAREWDLRRLRLAHTRARPNNGQNSNGGHEP